MQDPGTCQTKETRESISRKLELWEAVFMPDWWGIKRPRGRQGIEGWKDRRVMRRARRSDSMILCCLESCARPSEG